MKNKSFLTLIIYFLTFTFVKAAEGHSHELPGFLHFMEELIEEHSILRGATFGFIHTLIPLVGFYTGWSINRFLKMRLILRDGPLVLILFNFRLQLSGISYFCPYGITRRRF